MKDGMILKGPSFYERTLFISVFKRNVTWRPAPFQLLCSECQYLTLSVVAVTASSTLHHPDSFCPSVSHILVSLESCGGFVKIQIAGPHSQI